VLETNVIGTQNIVDACKKFAVEVLFFASTAAIYGVSDRPHVEDETPDPIDLYGLSKFAGEKLVSLLATPGGTRVRIGRYFNAVGHRETNPHLIPEIVSQLRNSSGPITLRLGNTTPRRDYIAASDLASGSYRMMTADYPEPLDIANIGTGLEHSVDELVGRFEQLLQRPIIISVDPARIRAVDRQHLCANASKMLNQYHWAPEHNLDSMLMDLTRMENVFCV
jgi:UDP-glucose 4-epimerase